MKETLREIKWNFVLSALLYLLLGVVLAIWPDGSAKMLCYCIGGVVTAYGVFNIVAYFTRRGLEGLHPELLAGIVAVAFGVFTLLKPTVIAGILPFVLGLIIVVDGAVNLKRAMTLRSLDFSKWGIYLLLSCLTILLGVGAVLNPFESLTLLLRLIGLVLIYEGISDLWAIFRISSLARAVEHAAEDIVHQEEEQAEDFQRQRSAVDVTFTEEPKEK